jgi:hypothetical protein
MRYNVGAVVIGRQHKEKWDSGDKSPFVRAVLIEPFSLWGAITRSAVRTKGLFL